MSIFLDTEQKLPHLEQQVAAKCMYVINTLLLSGYVYIAA